MISIYTERSSRRLAEAVRLGLSAAVIHLGLTTAACSDPVYHAPSAKPEPRATGDGPAPTPNVIEEDAGATDPDRPLEVLKFQFASAVKNREPVDKMLRARPGERVYAYVTLRNRSGRERKVHVSFRVNGKSRTEVDLDIAESWSFRTWAYNTVLKTDKPGKLEVFITDEGQDVLVEESLPITP